MHGSMNIKNLFLDLYAWTALCLFQTLSLITCTIDPNMHNSCPLRAFSCIPYNDKSVINSDCDTGQLINASWSDNLIILTFAGDINKMVL